MLNDEFKDRYQTSVARRYYNVAVCVRHLSFIIYHSDRCFPVRLQRQARRSVSGLVTLNTTPLTTGTVAFHPAAGGPTAYGSIGPDGSYTLLTGNQHGLKSGEYVVTVVATGPPEPPSKEHMEPVGKLLTPASYGDVKTSPLRATVTPGSNRILLELK